MVHQHTSVIREVKGAQEKSRKPSSSSLKSNHANAGTPLFLKRRDYSNPVHSDSQSNLEVTPLYLQSQIDAEVDSALRENPVSVHVGSSTPPVDESDAPTELIMRQAKNDGSDGTVPPDKHSSHGFHPSKSGGSPLLPTIKKQIEAVLGSDLSDIRVHQDTEANLATESLAARAFAHKNNIWLAQDQRSDDLPLMAHEATHVLQQRYTSTAAFQRAPSGEGLRTADISVPWTEDSLAFYHRVVNSAARNRGFRGVSRASLYQPYHSLAAAMHSRISRRTPIVPPGSRIQLRASLWFDPSAFHGQVSSAQLEQLEEAVLRDSRVTGILTPTATVSGGAANRLGISETATLSFSSSPSATAAAFGGLRWHVATGSGTVTGGGDGRADLTTDASPGDLTLELRVEAGPTAGRVATSLTVEVVDWPVVGGRPGSVAQASANLLDVSGGVLQHVGTVTASPSSTAGEVTVTAPRVSFNAIVSLKPSATLAPGTSIQVGPVQTAMSSERVAVYRRGGTPTGDIVAERRITVPRTRDAQFQDSPTGPVQDVAPPWYSRPAGQVGPPSISNTTRSQPVNYLDQPSFDLPTDVGNGTLTETRGQESFITSIVAIHNGNQVHLKSTSWSIPWNLTIPTGGTAVGGAINSTEIRFGAPLTTGPITVASPRDVLVFTSAADAAAAPTALLLQHLEETRRLDPAAGAIIAAGLVIKNPIFTINLTVDKGSDLIPPEDFDLTAAGHRTVSRSGFSVAEGSSVTITYSFNSLFNSSTLSSGDSINFSILDVGSPIPQMNWPFPFNDATSPASFTSGNGGEYTITGNLR